MANSYFQFKQFKVEQSETAMKVCTDSCILGAAVHVKDSSHVLDIGTGTGLLSLMMAQRSNAFIDAVEIDAKAAAQALENVKLSPWSNRIDVIHTSIQDFSKQKKYDLILSNPPFYSDSLKSESEERNKALHQTMLSPEELLEAANKFLAADGRFVVLLPSYEAELFREEALSYGLYSSAVLKIKDTSQAKVLREITEFRKEISLPTLSELIIKDEGGAYSEGFKSLLKEYYLYL